MGVPAELEVDQLSDRDGQGFMALHVLWAFLFRRIGMLDPETHRAPPFRRRALRLETFLVPKAHTAIQILPLYLAGWHPKSAPLARP